MVIWKKTIWLFSGHDVFTFYRLPNTRRHVARDHPDKSLLGAVPIFWVIPVVIDIVTSILLLIIGLLAIVGMEILLAVTLILSLSGSLIQRNRDIAV